MSPANDNGPRLLGRKEASAYLGISESTFSMWVATHKMPPSVPGTRKWDRKAIDDKLDKISGLGGGVASDNLDNEFAHWERANDERKAKGASEGKKAPRKR